MKIKTTVMLRQLNDRVKYSLINYASVGFYHKII